MGNIRNQSHNKEIINCKHTSCGFKKYRKSVNYVEFARDNLKKTKFEA
ncbi:hypothetical protein Bhyg_09306, partial [Pseudolycoriella hygida]